MLHLPMPRTAASALGRPSPTRNHLTVEPSRRQLLVGLAATTVGAAVVAPLSPALAQLQIDITRANPQPMPIAVLDFVPQGNDGQRYGRDIAQVVAADLERSGLFRPIERGAWIQQPDAVGVLPRYSDWRAINAQALVTGGAGVQADGRLRVEFRLWDVFGEQSIEGQILAAHPSSWRRIAHKVSDLIWKRVTGEDGHFDTEIVFISESGPTNARRKRLAIMDQDGANLRFLLPQTRDIMLTPRFSPVTRDITYMSYFNNRPRVYITNLDTGQQELLGDFSGMSFAPRFSPDGNRVVMSLAEGGATTIYELDLRSRRRVQLTQGRNIDTSPSYAPDGRRIVFNSDRGGAPHLYVMGADGSNPTRISFGQGRYSTPVWSPRGDLIAFTVQRGGQFGVGVMRPDGTGERILSESFLDEGPTWSPNGRVIMFFRQSPSDGRGNQRSRLMQVNISGANLREVPTPEDASDPAWSPLIP
ncbi:MAG: Tol-Pal system beta propeller repeat protein TolB [Alphaproteobacteria bacterium]|nr:Tol-Pal system beta propeller repeat protein TolB [Alphaproteobacteria bacterium]